MNTSISRRALLTGLGGLTVAGGVGGVIGLGRAATADPPGVSDALRVGYLPITDASPLLIAHSAKLYDPAAVSSTKPVLFRSWSSLAEAFVTRKVDVVHLLMPMAVALRYSMNSPVQVLGWNHTNGSALTVAPDIVELGQLAGSQIAIPAWWSIHNIILQRLLRQHDLRPVIRSGASRGDRTVELVVMSPSDMVPALANGSIGGYVVADPFNAMAQVRGIGRIHTFLGDVWRQHACCALLVHQSAIDERPAAVQSLADSVVAAQHHLDLDRRRAASELSGGYLPQPKPAIAKALTYDPADFTVANPGWQPQRLGFEPFPFPSFTERLVTEMDNTIVDGDRRFLDRIDPTTVHADLVDDRFIRTAIGSRGGAVALGLPADLTRTEQVTS
ncbi:ABC transporter substrate-binding protein [Gordonia terrae]|uniref:ABC transporter substrate-binding protein n=1 Tax=Gordonia terrae TaxID=2055 RepID=UPI003F6BE6E0